MCGRFTLASDSDAMNQMFFEFTIPMNLSPRYNISPTQDVAVIAELSETRQVEFFHWGLIPSWAKDPKIGNRMINARSETLSEKPSFRNAYKRRRCLILADGYYEWKQVPGDRLKQPVYIRLKSQKPFALAGLWEIWQVEGMDKPLRSCTIITCPPNALLEEIHHRMPVILPKDAYAEWLSPEAKSSDALQRLLIPYSDEEIEAYPVSRFVNHPTNDSPECIAPSEVTQSLN
ncbi:SOS response-associated protein yoqW [Geodia barretti]|uniref:Abasic site processing protein HMCES n=1 Tax=Geodia barretti TaxID=519541 RepID=A0AA35S8N6_GEOBA|nr:SOS response-associated protein yoqW [Geodia barretti]